jgi:hypothetical protein
MTNDPSKNRPLRLVTNADLQRLIESRDNVSGFVTMLHPLELYIARPTLEAMTRDSLAAIRDNRLKDETADQRVAADRAIQQRVDFLAWLSSQPDEVYMAIYPAEMDGLDELDDLQDLIDDDTPPLPDLF